ncbi:MAG: alpha-ketoglutarate-dependent dioxygenase AlkB [Bacteroidetes bacterium]|nr:alpha-ketoglutarate-dependent dioxygenase AlkB [Bacteroidota bacterium]MDA0860777.1 alpha-ketoglutarate-dependent dioxygenase AlkB [Bacteroidota bacterium]MDA1318890.1 alpha-ketoglutarate-dependent dioxygenase AlkB [Bacteroidota bacterium]
MLFGVHNNITTELKDGEISYDKNFLSSLEASRYFKVLRNETAWQQDQIKVFGKVYDQPRLTALFANNNFPYRYSNITMYPSPFSATLLEIKEKVEQQLKKQFTTCLLNLYRHGQDSNGWHADNEKELGKNPIIASVSLGAERMFHMKHRTEKSQKIKINLTHGSLLVMSGSTQHYWLHQIPKTKKHVEERINLTFRILK